MVPGWEDLLEKGKVTHSSIRAWGCKESDMTKQLPLSLRHKGFEVFTSSYVHVQPGNGESYYQLVFTEKDARV